MAAHLLTPPGRQGLMLSSLVSVAGSLSGAEACGLGAAISLLATASVLGAGRCRPRRAGIDAGALAKEATASARRPKWAQGPYDGRWVDPLKPDLVMEIRGGTVRWHTGIITDGTLKGSKLYTTLEGRKYCATLEEAPEGDCLHWDDGDVWLRDEEPPLLSAKARVALRGGSESQWLCLHGDLLWFCSSRVTDADDLPKLAVSVLRLTGAEVEALAKPPGTVALTKLSQPGPSKGRLQFESREVAATWASALRSAARRPALPEALELLAASGSLAGPTPRGGRSRSSTPVQERSYNSLPCSSASLLATSPRSLQAPRPNLASTSPRSRFATDKDLSPRMAVPERSILGASPGRLTPGQSPNASSLAGALTPRSAMRLGANPAQSPSSLPALEHQLSTVEAQARAIAEIFVRTQAARRCTSPVAGTAASSPRREQAQRPCYFEADRNRDDFLSRGEFQFRGQATLPLPATNGARPCVGRKEPGVFGADRTVR